MKRIKLSDSLSTNLYTEYSNINSIEIEDKYFNSGGFGMVYHCVSIDGKKPPKSQVIKIFFNSNKNVDKAMSTIQGLQRKISDEASDLKRNNIKFEDEYSALLACPQFSFTGILDGKEVNGYSANNLVACGFEEFQDLLTKDFDNFKNTPIKNRLSIAYDLTKSFELLRSFMYIHADIKAEAIFINLNKSQCAIIDFDSGAIMQSESDKPTTWGTPQDWLAPEILSQFDDKLKNRQNAVNNFDIEVDLRSDQWSVAVCIHHILFNIHPFQFFTEITLRSIKEYSKSKVNLPKFPNQFRYINTSPESQQLLKWYESRFLKAIPSNLQQRIANTFSKGCINPSLRASYEQWNVSLSFIKKPAKIKSFSASQTHLKNTSEVVFNWLVENSTNVYLNGINVSQYSSYKLIILKDTIIKLEAKNGNKVTSKKISITTSKEKPNIKFFESNVINGQLTSSDNIRLAWNVENFEKIEINNGVGDVTKRNEIVIPAPRKNVQYELKAWTIFGVQASKKFTLNIPITPPEITVFETDIDFLTKKSDMPTLRWQVKGAERVELNNNIGEVMPNSQLKLRVLRDTKFVLKATSYFGYDVEQVVKIIVSKKPPTVTHFFANKGIVTKVEDIHLSWKVDNAVKVEIDQGIGDVTSQDSTTYRLTKPQTFKLTATSHFGAKATASVSIITLKRPPRIKSFESNVSQVINNDPITLSWDVADARSIIIDNGIGDVTSLNQVSVPIDSDTTFILKAVSHFEGVAYRKIKVYVSKVPPMIYSFKTISGFLNKGEETILEWNVKGAKRVWIDQGIGTVPITGQAKVFPKNDKTYTLTAENHFGYFSKAHVYLKVFEKQELNINTLELSQIPKLNV